MRLVLTLLSCLTFLTCIVRSASPGADSAIHALSPDEFAKAGLNKLTPEELVYLEEAIARHQQGLVTTAPTDSTTTAPVAPTKKVVQSTDKAATAFGAEQVVHVDRVVTEQELHAHIEGTLEGFSGRAVFVLDNGQIWQQRIPDTVYFSPTLVNPEVVITRGLVGYKMLIVDANRVVFVKRIQ